MEPIQTLVTVSFTLLALLAARLHRQRRSAPTLWVLAMCSAVAAGLLLRNVLAPALPPAEPLLNRMGSLAILAFPYLLYRFAVSFRGVRLRTESLVAVVVGATMLAAVALGTPGTPATLADDLILLAVAAVWTGLTAWVVWTLARAGRRQPALAQRRVWTLAVAAATLNVALVLAGASTREPWTAINEPAHLLALVSAGAFMLAFAPPRFVRTIWRRSDELDLQRVEGDLMAATTRAEVIASMLGHTNRLLAGDGALFIDQAGESTTHGIPATDAGRYAAEVAGAELPGRTTVTVGELSVLALRGGRLGVVISPYTPMFGEDEYEVLNWMGALTDLALSRADLYDGERSARARAESLTAELEALVYGISHDLRSPMVSVLGYLAYLVEEHGDRLDADGRHVLSRIQVNTAYMDKLISDLLELSRAGDVQEDAKAVELGPLAREVADEVRRDYPEATFYVAALPRVLISPPRARQLLSNLLGNAAAHSGRPDVTVRVTTITESPTQVCIAVRDDGRGIPPEWRERVFGIFERVGGDEPGERHSSGIGLAISRKIVERAGGRIWAADSEAGADLRVQLLPASGLAADPAPADA